MVPASPTVRLRAVPNPLNAEVRLEWAGALGNPATLRLHSLDGRLIATIVVEGSAPAGSVSWDGRDARGRLVSSGLYLVRVVGPAAGGTTKLIVVR